MQSVRHGSRHGRFGNLRCKPCSIQSWSNLVKPKLKNIFCAQARGIFGQALRPSGFNPAFYAKRESKRESLDERSSLTPGNAYNLKPKDYTLTQLRYDIRKLRLHGLIERLPKSYAYRFTEKGTKLSILLVQVHKRIYGPFGLWPLANQTQPGTPARFLL
jgi:hypothetical protein